MTNNEIITGKLAGARFDSEKARLVHLWLELDEAHFLALSQAIGQHIKITILAVVEE